MPSTNVHNSVETIRRTRGTAPNERAASPAGRIENSTLDRAEASHAGSHAAKKANGHANGSANHAATPDGAPSAKVRVQGSGRAFFSVPAAPLPAPLLPEAASDDASGASVAIAATSAVAEGADRGAYAAAAEGTNGNKRRSSHSDERPRVPSETMHYPGGEAPLPEHPADFVEEVHSKVDLFEVWKGLLNSGDDKIRQRAAEKLTEMLYKGAAAMEEEPQKIVFDWMRPKLD